MGADVRTICIWKRFPNELKLFFSAALKTSQKPQLYYTIHGSASLAE
ncbi:MAG: hypothetical protein U0941_19565 [Planctomycetaceae bacterium]